MENVDYIICLTGTPSSYEQTLGIMQTLSYLQDNKKRVSIRVTKGNNIYEVRNGCLKGNSENHRVNQKPFEGNFDDYDKMIWIDSDNIITASHVKKLLSYDLDIVCGWYKVLGNEIASCGNDQIPYSFNQLKSIDRLLEVDYTGMGLMVVKKGVFESLTYPWFKSWVKEWVEDDEKMSRVVFDDECFCDRVKEQGFKIYVDTSVYIEHEKKGLI